MNVISKKDDSIIEWETEGNALVNLSESAEYPIEKSNEYR